MPNRLLIALLATCLATPAYASSDAAKRFGIREDVQQISLSPDGKHIAFIEPVGARGSAVIVLDAQTGAQTTAVRSSGSPDRLKYCRWSTDTRLVCGVYMVVDGAGESSAFSRMISVNADGKELKVLSARDSADALATSYSGGGVIDWLGEKGDGSLLMVRTIVPDRGLGTRLGETRSGFAVEKVDTLSLQRSSVEGARTDAVEYITDGHGAVRIMGLRETLGTGYDAAKITYMYRRAGSRSWEPLGTLAFVGGKEVGFNPYAVDRDRNVVYGFDQEGGRKALFAVALDGSKTRTLVMSRPDVDVDEVVQVGRQKRVVGASYATEKRQVEFFDPELKKLAGALGKAMPGLPIISFIDASADESKLLLFAGTDTDPGHYYLYDKASHKLDEITPVRPQLADIKLASVKPITYAAADGTQIPGYLTLPPGSVSAKGLPAIVLPHGGPEARDEWGFDWLSQFFANRGYAVLQPNFRGSTGYGEAWFRDNGFKSWRTAIGDVNDAGRWLVKQGIADPSKLAIVGWSYGGYAALQSAVLDPALFKAIVAVAPVTDLEALRTEHAEYTDFAVQSGRIGVGPHVRQGSPAQNAASFLAPVLMFHGDRDQNVGVAESRLMLAKLKAAGKSADLVEFKGLDHQLDDSAARIALLDKADTFLRTTMGMPPLP